MPSSSEECSSSSSSSSSSSERPNIPTHMYQPSKEVQAKWNRENLRKFYAPRKGLDYPLFKDYLDPTFPPGYTLEEYHVHQWRTLWNKLKDYDDKDEGTGREIITNQFIDPYLEN